MIANFTEMPGRPLAAPATHRNEFPARYSLAGWSPPEPTSASLTALILQLSKRPVQENPANGNCPNSRLSQKRAHPTRLGARRRVRFLDLRTRSAFLLRLAVSSVLVGHFGRVDVNWKFAPGILDLRKRAADVYFEQALFPAFTQVEGE